MVRDRSRLNELLEAWGAAAPYEGTGLNRLPEIMEICYERARVTGVRQKLMWNPQHKSWYIVNLEDQPLP